MQPRGGRTECHGNIYNSNTTTNGFPPDGGGDARQGENFSRKSVRFRIRQRVWSGGNESPFHERPPHETNDRVHFNTRSLACRYRVSQNLNQTRMAGAFRIRGAKPRRKTPGPAHRPPKKHEEPNMSKCPRCKHEITPSDQTCPGCGVKLRWKSRSSSPPAGKESPSGFLKRLCPKCKHEIALGNPTCPGCGAPLHWGSRPSGSASVKHAKGSEGTFSQKKPLLQELPDKRYLDFFSTFCRVVLIAFFLAALLVFYVKIPSEWIHGGLRGWGEPEYVRLFDVFEFFDSVFGEGNLAVRYWFAVLASCTWILAEGLYAKSVAETVWENTNILSFWEGPSVQRI